MDYAKVDAALALALQASTQPDARTLPVFIHTEVAPTDEQRVFLQRAGVASAVLGKRIMTATLSPRAVEQIAEQGWVRYLKLGSALRSPT
jgi:hypothetical protein